MIHWGWIAAGAFALGMGSGWQVRDWKAGADETKAVKAGIAKGEQLQDNVAAPAATYEGDKADAQLKAGVRAQAVRIIYRDRVVDHFCAVDPAARGVLDDAIADANAAARGEPRGAVPAAEPAP